MRRSAGRLLVHAVAAAIIGYGGLAAQNPEPEVLKLEGDLSVHDWEDGWPRAGALR
jgi:hypothetical protein